MGIDIMAARASTYAAISVFFALIFTVIAFSTPYWLSADGKSPRRTFLNLGLWEACFTSFRDPNYQYDREFRGCKWLFDEDYTFLLDILEPRKCDSTSCCCTILCHFEVPRTEQEKGGVRRRYFGRQEKVAL